MVTDRKIDMLMWDICNKTSLKEHSDLGFHCLPC